MYGGIVVGTDGSARAGVAVEHAAALARATGAALHLVYAYRSPSTTFVAAPELGAVGAVSDRDATDAANGVVNDLAARLRSEGVRDVHPHACAVPAVDALCDVAKSVGADVIVVGNKGMTGVRRVLGSVPNGVAHHADCAVLIVPTN